MHVDEVQPKMQRPLVLGTRGSKLALAQSEMIAAALMAAHPGLRVELMIISTKGDRVLDVALSAVGDKGLFVKELEQALLANEVDLCVHSCKDLPSALPEGLTLAAFPARADVRDVLVRRLGDWEIGRLGEIENGQQPGEPPPQSLNLSISALVGTSSLRRAAQLRALRPDLQLRDVRGNVDTRLRKLTEGQYDAIVLAAAGLVRLGLWDGESPTFALQDTTFAITPFATNEMLPAVAQGILAVECRAADTTTRELLAVLDHGPTRAVALAERAFLGRLEGGCQVPMAAYAQVAGDTLQINGLVAALDGATLVRGVQHGPSEDAVALGITLAEELLAQGAEAILEEIRVAR
jgi:hydroxymethylbilane synthase